jgi:nitrous oxidase accessory protein NosD
VTTVQRALRGVALPVLVLLSSAAHRAAAATITLSPGHSLAAALAQAADGDTIEISAGRYPGEVGGVTQRRLTLRGVAGRPVLLVDGRSAEGKSIPVVRSAHENSDIRVENIEFRGARVADRNGAGIRFERGQLQVVHCAFVDNENGILTAGHADAELSISDSDFSQAPPATSRPHLPAQRAGRRSALDPVPGD